MIWQNRNGLFLTFILLAFSTSHCGAPPDRKANTEAVTPEREVTESAEENFEEPVLEESQAETPVLDDVPAGASPPAQAEKERESPASPAAKRAMRGEREGASLESRLRAYSNFNLNLNQLIARGDWSGAAALQEQAFDEFFMLYQFSEGARLRAQFRLRDLYEASFAFDHSDSLKAVLAPEGEVEEASPTTEPDPLFAGNEVLPIFLGLIDPDPEEMSGTRGVKKVNESNFTIRGYIHAYDGLRSFTINEQRVGIGPNAMFRQALQLEEGLNPVYFEAASQAGAVRRDTFYLNYERDSVSLSREPGKFILTIALQDYDPDGEWPPLKTPLADARSFTRLATDRYGFEVFDTLYNRRATRENVVETLKRLRFQTHPDDDIIIYYAGHGRYDDEYTMQGYWVFNDGEWSNSDQLAYLNRIPASDILIIADACFAGSFYFEHAASEAGQAGERARWILASGRLERVQDLLPGREEHSPFAYPLLEYLEERVEPFTAYELGQSISDEVFELTGHSQKPIVRPFSGDTGGEWVFEPVLQRD